MIAATQISFLIFKNLIWILYVYLMVAVRHLNLELALHPFNVVHSIQINITNYGHNQ